MYYNIALNPKNMSIIPANISRYLDGNFCNLPPRVKPKIELINVINVIKIAGLSILFPYKERDIPAENASILVAIPIINKQRIPIHRILSFCFWQASIINFAPRYANIKNTIIGANGAIYDFTKFVIKYAIVGIIPWNSPVNNANAMQCFNLFSFSNKP